MGIEPFLVASSLMALLAQRLVRRLCPECREPYKPADEDLASIGIDPAAFARGAGAARAVQGRRGVRAAARACCSARARAAARSAWAPATRAEPAIYELLIIDEKIRQLALKNADAQTHQEPRPCTTGMRTLRDDGAQKVLAGMTTTAEVLMITTQDVE